MARSRLLDWCAWAQRLRLVPFCKAAATVKSHLEGIVDYVRTRWTTAISAGKNGKMRTITRRSFGFHDVSALIAMIFLCCSGIRIPLPHRVTAVCPTPALTGVAPHAGRAST